jgi:hypothetical protein
VEKYDNDVVGPYGSKVVRQWDGGAVEQCDSGAITRTTLSENLEYLFFSLRYFRAIS